MTNRWTLGLGLLMLGCGGAQSAPNPPPATSGDAPAPGAVAPAGASTATVAAAGAPGAAPAGTGGQAAVGAPVKPEEPSLFSIVGVSESSYSNLAIYGLGDKVFIGGSGFLAQSQGDELVDASVVLGQLKLSSERLLGLFGAWPDRLYAVIEELEGCNSSETSIAQYSGGKWARLVRNQPYAQAAAVLAGGGLAMLSGWNGGATLDIVGGGKTKTPTLVGEDGPFTGDDYDLSLEYLVAADDGSVFVGGRRHDQAVVGRSDGKKVTVLPLPCKEDGTVELGGMVRGVGAQAYAYGSRKVGKNDTALWARFDGNRWTCHDVPGLSFVRRMSVGSDGSAYLIGAREKGSELRQLLPDGSTKNVALPRSLGKSKEILFAPSDLYVASRDDVWVTGEFEGMSTALHTRPAKSVYKFPEEDTAMRELEEYQSPVPATPACESIFVMLYTLAKTAPANYDFPLTREALKGHSEFASLKFIEAQSLGRRYFGAMVRNLAEGKKLSEVVKKGVPGSSPVMLCREPAHVNREIKFDIKTGKMIP